MSNDKIRSLARAFRKADPRLNDSEAQALASAVLELADRGKRERWIFEELELLPKRKRVTPLTKKLRELRELKGFTQYEAAHELGWYADKVMRIENGTVRLTKGDLILLLRLYQVSGTPAQELAALAGFTFGQLRP